MTLRHRISNLKTLITKLQLSNNLKLLLMKMEVQQKLINLSIIIFFGFGFLLFVNSCKNSKEADIGYGKTYFMNNCSACHGLFDGFKNGPSILTMYNYDSLVLIQKLRKIKKDAIHKDFLNSAEYSKLEINSIYKYIKNYFEPRP